ncbi:MAG: DHHA1 domain-containing protein [Vulcanimicrobiota bacterium]
MQPETVTHILYHADCADGFGAAYAAWKVLGDAATYIPVTHGEEPPELPAEARVAIVDFSYQRGVILELAEGVEDMVILDHHATAQEELEGLSFATFDMHKSGARMAWEYWHPDQEVPDLIAYIEDKDLWLWNLEKSKEFTIALHSYPMEFELWDKLSPERLKLEGGALLRLQDQLIQSAVNRTRFQTLFGHQVPVVNATEFRSEIANHLCSLHPEVAFAAAYYDDKNGERNWSLRSIGDFDVSELARSVGGGGHKNASGFTGDPL